MNIMNSPDAGTTAHDLNTNISSKRLSIIICPPSMLAKRRIVSAKGLVKSPMNSTGANISIMASERLASTLFLSNTPSYR